MFGRAIWKLIVCESYTDDIVPIFCSYSSAIFAAQTDFRQQSPVLLPMTATFCSKVYTARGHLRKAAQILSPVFREAREKMDTRSDRDTGPIEWILKNAKENQSGDDEYLTKLLLAYGIAFVFAASPTGATIGHKSRFSTKVLRSDQGRSLERR